MAGGIGFAGFLVVAVNSLQTGTFEMMIDSAARFFAGHVQVQHPAFFDEPRPGNALGGVAARVAALERGGGFEAVAPHAQAFALLSKADGEGGETPAFGGLVVGVDAEREFAAIRDQAASGRYLQRSGEAYLGGVLARNLGVAVGDEVAILGNAEEGGVAAMVASVVGTFSTGQADFDRSQLHVPLGDFQRAFGLQDGAHAIALLLADQSAARGTAAELGDGTVVGRPWQDLELCGFLGCAGRTSRRGCRRRRPRRSRRRRRGWAACTTSCARCRSAASGAACGTPWRRC